MANEITFNISRTRFDEDYSPADSSRLTTNFANLARGEHRRKNLRAALAMIDRRCNELAAATTTAVSSASASDRYRVELDIVSVTMHFADQGRVEAFPLLEMLDVAILDQHTGERHQGILGNNFSSYLRDYDFAVRLPAVNAATAGTTAAGTAAAGTTAAGTAAPSIPDDFGDLHGLLFREFLDSDAYREQFTGLPVVCISVSTSQTYRRTETVHPVLGVEYEHAGSSLTDDYFGRMGMQVRYFMPPGGAAPLAFYALGDVLHDYSDLQLVGTISTMETFQKIYRPEIYAANTPAPDTYRPTLAHEDYTAPSVSYDREERSRLAVTQGRYTEEHLVEPHRELLERWAATRTAALR